MNISLVTIAYNGYGRFVDQWLNAVSMSSTLPDKVIVALGPNHGLDNHNDLLEKYKELDLQFHFCENTKPLMGPMRNQVVNEADTEWIMYLSVDDVLLPPAIDEFARLEDEADYICISWYSRATWKPDAELSFHQGKTPELLATKFNGRGFINAQSPFRKKFWLMESYMDHDYPNAPFLAGCVKNGARFVHTDVGCTTYLQRLDSHAARLGRRRSTKIEAERQKAIYWKQYARQAMLDRYREVS